MSGLSRVSVAASGSAGTTPRGLLVNRPAATGSGLSYFATDDGLGTEWLDQAAGVWVPVGGKSLLAQMTNATGVTTSCAAGAQVSIPGSLTVPASSRPVYLSALVKMRQTAVGTGLTQLQVRETTSVSSGVWLTQVHVPHPNSVSTNSRSFTMYLPLFDVGASASQRTFKLTIENAADSLSPAVEALNLAPGNETWLRAEVL